MGTAIAEQFGDFHRVRTGIGRHLAYFEVMHAFLVRLKLCHGQLAAKQQA